MMFSHCPGIWLSGRSSSEEGVGLIIHFRHFDLIVNKDSRESLDKPVTIIYSSNGVPQYYQVLDEVFSDMYPPDSLMMIHTYSHLLDLGQVGQDNQTRICAVMTGKVFTLVIDADTGCASISDLSTSLLFISMFDVEMLQLTDQIPRPPHVPPNTCQLLKVSTVKKLVFRLEKSFYPMFNTFVL
ncbi:hypothetical protein RJT34_18761 [Clitoria ternatea]|uniref:Uncharacterized protein n=1 Tax=Clitoria ternatea TaxID=43366 RepID=A0AAN9PFR3_CLITE